MSSGASSNASNSVMGRLEAIVLEHLETADFDVETFSRLSGLSRSDLYRKIKKHTGKSVTEFVRDIRLKKSLEYLQDEERTASEVAYLVGFSSATYFSKCFKDKYGFTPGEANNHKEKINELLGESHQSEKTSEQRKSFFKPITLLIVFISIALIGWYFISAYNTNKISESTTESTTESSIDSMKDINTNNEMSVAVLLVQNHTLEEELEAICYLLTFDLINQISQYDNVPSNFRWNSALAMKDSLTALPLKVIAERIHVDHVLDGKLFKYHDQYRLALELIDIKNNKVLWEDKISYQRGLEHYEQIVINSTKEIIKALGHEINSYAATRVANTKSELAHDYFSQGLYHISKYTHQGWENARELFEKAIEEDPEFTNAYFQLAELWSMAAMNWAYASQDSAWTNAKFYNNKVLELDPGNENAIKLIRGGYFYFELNVADTIPELGDNNLQEWFYDRNDFTEKLGHHQKSLQINKKVMKRNPTRGVTYALLAINYYYLNQPEKALEILDENYPLYNNDINFLKEAAKAWYFLGEYNKMEMAVLRYFEIFEEEEYTPWIRWLRAIVADKNNDQEMVKEQLGHLLENYNNEKSGSPAWFIALYHAYKNDVDKTLEWLEKSYEAGEIEMTWLAQEPDLHIVGDQPRYRALLDSMNFSQSARRHVISSE